jgi:hypothetical protein
MKHAILFLLIISLTTSAAVALNERTSTVRDREGVNLTIYNANLALVHDRRSVRLDSGLNRIAWRDVSAQMDPTSALLEASGATNRVDVLEQNFNFGLLDPNALLQKFVGHTVVVVHDPEFAGQLQTRESARVLSANNGIVLQYKDRIETSVRGHIIYPDLPPNFRDRPTLALDLKSQAAQRQSLDLSYLTAGLAWSADYVGTLNSDQTALSLTGLVTLSNMSGASYEQARLQLVAGNVNVAPAAGTLREIGALKPGTTSDTYSAVSQENYFEYHLYTMARPSTILDKQTKQLTLLQARDVPVRTTLELRGGSNYYQNAEPDLGDRIPVGAYVSFQNKGGDLGVPLPGGIVRLYKNDSHGLAQFLGSDRIDHTPRNEHVRLHLGDSFDVTARKRQTDYHVDLLDSCSSESSYDITISNAKSLAQDVLVVEPLPGEWQITSENIRHTKSSSSTADWTVHVPADSHATLNYTARVKWC